MAAIGIIVALIVAAVGIAVGVVGGLAGAALGLLGSGLGLLVHLFPLVLIALGILWLLKGSNAGDVAGARAERGNVPPPQSPCKPR